MEKYFFEIPIYRCSYEHYLSDLDKLENKITRELEPILKENYPEKFEEIKKSRYMKMSYPYEYNEIIGWIKLFIMGSQVRGEYYFETNLDDKEKIKKRFDKGIRKKRFEFYGKAFELSINKELKSSEISELILERIKELKTTEQPFKGRYIDIRKLENITEFIDWKSLIKELNLFK